MSHQNGTCPHCGGDLIGDGVHDVLHCENVADPTLLWDREPDSGPVYCNHGNGVRVPSRNHFRRMGMWDMIFKP